MQQNSPSCVQVLPQITSFYFWENEVQAKDSEQLLLIKTLPEKFDRIEKILSRKITVMTCRKLSRFRAEKVAESYLNWMKDYIEKM
ncbi:MAG: divalent cation tolerance protein CutA [Pyrinomonadaceae bacterium]